MFVRGNISEEDLISRCRSGDSDAYSILMKGYKEKLYGYLFRYSYNKFIADDMMQEVLIKTWKGLKRYDEKKRFASWLFTIAHNVAVDKSRRKNHFNPIEDIESFQDTRSNDPHEKLVEKETQELLERAVMKLPDKQKEVFLLRKNGEMTFKEIAELMDESINTVLGHMHYAVKKLRTAIEVENAK